MLAVVLPLYEPVRLAEEMVVLDIISNGRVSYVCAVGYREDEYDMFGVDLRRRGRVADEWLSVLLRAKTGEPFDHDGRTIRVTPMPVSDGGPSVSWGGGSDAAARRAGRNGLGFFAQTDDESLRRAFEDAARGAGHRPGPCYLPPRDLPTCLFVADDVDRAWEELGPFLMHDARSYAAMNPGDSATASLSFAGSVGRTASGGEEPPDRGCRRGDLAGQVGTSAAGASPGRWPSTGCRLALPAHGDRCGDARPLTGDHGPAPWRPWLAVLR